MGTVNVRTLKDKLTSYLRRAEAGERVIVERDGKPIAALVPLSDVPERDEDSILAGLMARGVVVLPSDPGRVPFATPRVPGRGRSAAAMVLEDRE